MGRATIKRLTRTARKEEGLLPCPSCGSGWATVTDSRIAGKSVRRRRQCAHCLARWTTYEVPIAVLQALAAVAKRIDAPRRLRIYADAIERIDELVAASLQEVGE
jgi:hypothetical protein